MMTSQKESWTAGREALSEVTTHSDRTDQHEDALSRYLAGATTADLHRHPATAHAEPPAQPDAE
jgi:hypothetical protein